MTTTTGVFLPDESEHSIPKKSSQSVRANGDKAKKDEPANADRADPAKLSEQELKSAIIATWKKHEELAKQDLAPMLYWLRDKLRAQGARNDLTQDKDRGFGFWVEEHLDISRRTADRWCDWYAVEMGYKQDATSGQASKSEVDVWEDILDNHKGKQQIAMNFWVKTAIHKEYQQALTKIQNKFGLKDKKEALVRGVIYAASVINKGAMGRPDARVVGKLSVSHGRPGNKIRGRRQVRESIRTTNGARKVEGTKQILVSAKREARNKQGVRSTNGHRGGSGVRAAGAAAGR
jgi:hypothetical protein